MAAQERAKQGTVAPPTATPDLLDSFDTPAASAAAAPPAFDASLLPPQQQQAPPAFDALDLPPPTTTQQSPDLMMDSWDPMAPPPVAAAPAASAPVFEDLLEEPQLVPDSKPSYTMTPVAPPSSAGGMDQEAIDAILGIEGLSDEEKAALIAEQEKIMASIEKDKKSANSAEARANAFEQRSHAAAVQAMGGGSTTAARSAPPPKRVNIGHGQEVALHGQDKTHQAIQDGTAVMVECPSCSNWMQVTKQATMMMCPICQTVSPVQNGGTTQTAPLTDEELAKRLQQEEEQQSSSATGNPVAASQMLSDQELAEQLQKEEYKQADKRQAAAAKKKKEAQAKAAPQQGEQGWMDWIMGTTPSTDSHSPDRSFAQRPLKPGEIGVSLPPGASRNNAALAAAPTYTGRDSDVGTSGGSDGVRWSASADPDGFDMDGGTARVAESKPLFNCVADSISSAANQMYAAVSTDDDGNVHGVDGHGLLAMSNAGRNAEYQNMD